MPISPHRGSAGAASAHATQVAVRYDPQCPFIPWWRVSSFPDRYKNSARALRADLSLDHLAGVARLELRAPFALLVAIGVILIGNRFLRDLWRCGGKVRRGGDCDAAGCTRRPLQKRAPAQRRAFCIHVMPSAQCEW